MVEFWLLEFQDGRGRDDGRLSADGLGEGRLSADGLRPGRGLRTLWSTSEEYFGGTLEYFGEDSFGFSCGDSSAYHKVVRSSRVVGYES